MKHYLHHYFHHYFLEVLKGHVLVRTPQSHGRQLATCWRHLAVPGEDETKRLQAIFRYLDPGGALVHVMSLGPLGLVIG